MNILVGYDNSNVANAAIELSKRHARAFNARIFLVRSMKGGADVPSKDFTNAELELNRANAAYGEESIASEPHLLVRGMSAGEDLVQFAREHNIDEIIIGVKRRSKVGKVLFGSTAQYVILNAPCPVVTIR
jgi:nucleotide-binding universal stress UspA family protein